MDELMQQQPDLMINISASPFDYDHDDDRKEIVRFNCLKYGLPMVYCNAVGSQTEIVFDGGSLVYSARRHGKGDEIFRRRLCHSRYGCGFSCIVKKKKKKFFFFFFFFLGGKGHL